jgi:ribulose-phosphate 3-epimerase
MHIVDLLWNERPALSVGVMSANMMLLGADITELENNDVRLLHFDVMDGHFVPHLTVGAWFVKAVKTTMLKDVHLMADNPFEAIPLYAAAGADIITVHVESGSHVRASLQRIGMLKNANAEGRGIARGIAINPSTSLLAIEPLLEETDIVTLVAINPGFPGQTFYWDTVVRAEKIRSLIAQTGKNILLCIDGGITSDTITEIRSMNPDIVVSGSAVFENNAVAKNLDMMRRSLRGEQR